MNPIVFRADLISPSVLLHPFVGEVPCVPGSPEPDRQSIRHLLIGPPEAVNLTIHRLHQLGYAEAGLWSPAIAFSSSELTLTLSPGEVMRVLRRSV